MRFLKGKRYFCPACDPKCNPPPDRMADGQGISNEFLQFIIGTPTILLVFIGQIGEIKYIGIKVSVA